MTPLPLLLFVFPARSLKSILYDIMPSLCNVELMSNFASQLFPLVLLMSIMEFDTAVPEISNVIFGKSIVSLVAKLNLIVSSDFANVL